MSSFMNNRAFGLMTRMKNSDGEFKYFAIGGVNIQTTQYIQEVEMYDKTQSVWKFYKNLPSDYLGQNGPDRGCVGKMNDSILFVGSEIVQLVWSSWSVSNLTAVPESLYRTKCSGLELEYRRLKVLKVTKESKR